MKTWEEVKAEEAATLEALNGCRDFQTLNAMCGEEKEKVAASEAANDQDAMFSALLRLSALAKGRNLVAMEYLHKIEHPGYV